MYCKPSWCIHQHNPVLYLLLLKLHSLMVLICTNIWQGDYQYSHSLLQYTIIEITDEDPEEAHDEP